MDAVDAAVDVVVDAVVAAAFVDVVDAEAIKLAFLRTPTEITTDTVEDELPCLDGEYLLPLELVSFDLAFLGAWQGT